jgi:hypothetical protein
MLDGVLLQYDMHVVHGKQRIRPCSDLTSPLMLLASRSWQAQLQWHVQNTDCLSTRPLHVLLQLNMSKWHGHFGTLMPFYRAWSAVKAPDRPLPEPQQLPVAKPSLKTE